MGTAWADMDKVERYKVRVGIKATGEVHALVTLYVVGRGRRFVIEPCILRALLQSVDELEADATRRLEDARKPRLTLVESPRPHDAVCKTPVQKEER